MQELCLALVSKYCKDCSPITDIPRTAWSQATIGDPAARSSSATSYLGPDFISRPNLDVLINAQVTKLIQTGIVAGKPSFHALQYAYPSTSKIISCPFALLFCLLQTPGTPLGFATAAVNATHEIVLSAGSIGTPQILLLSGIGPEADLTKVGIPTIVNNPSVGQNLSDHPLLANPYSVNGDDSFDHVFRGDNVSAAIGEWFSDKSGPLVDGVCNHLGFLRLPDNSTIFETEQDASAGPGAAHMEMIFSVCPVLSRHKPALTFIASRTCGYSPELERLTRAAS